jgi:seryl-tRNA synthetase
MWPLDELRSTLRARGDLWEVAPGLVGMRGATLHLYRALERRIAELCSGETVDDWHVPSALPLATLERAQYFTSFPQWLTLAAHLDDDRAVLRDVAESPCPGDTASRAMAPASAALTPAVCYHVYSALAGQRVTSPRIVTAQSTCWRHESPNHVALERDWAFTMREVVCVGTDADVRAFVARCMERVTEFAESIGLAHEIAEATDPFFAPTSRGKQVLQRVKALKRELLLPLSDDRSIAASSFNLHETFFGDTFGIRTGDGTPAFTGCVAFGIERWTLAFLVRHGTDPETWPSLADTGELLGAHT